MTTDERGDVSDTLHLEALLEDRDREIFGANVRIVELERQVEYWEPYIKIFMELNEAAMLRLALRGKCIK